MKFEPTLLMLMACFNLRTHMPKPPVEAPRGFWAKLLSWNCSKHQEAAWCFSLKACSHMLKFVRYCYALVNHFWGPDIKKYSDCSFEVWTDWNEVRARKTKGSPFAKLRSEYFPYGENNWVIRALLYRHNITFVKSWKCCREVLRKSINII